MEAIVLMFITIIASALFVIPVMTIYAMLEIKHDEKQKLRYAELQLMMKEEFGQDAERRVNRTHIN